MSGAFIPVWIIGAGLIGALVLAFSFKGPSSMSGGSGLRSDTRDPLNTRDPLSSRDPVNRNRPASY